MGAELVEGQKGREAVDSLRQSQWVVFVFIELYRHTTWHLLLSFPAPHTNIILLCSCKPSAITFIISFLQACMSFMSKLLYVINAVFSGAGGLSKLAYALLLNNQQWFPCALSMVCRM